MLLAAGGLGALLGVAGQPLVPPSVLAAATTALLNLSSYVPAQVWRTVLARVCLYVCVWLMCPGLHLRNPAAAYTCGCCTIGFLLLT